MNESEHRISLTAKEWMHLIDVSVLKVIQEHCNAREVVVARNMLRHLKNDSSSLHFDTTEVVGGHVERKKNHLRLTFGCEGGGGGKRRAEMPKKTIPARVWMRGKWW